VPLSSLNAREMWVTDETDLPRSPGTYYIEKQIKYTGKKQL